MMVLGKETTIPLPQVFSYSTTTENVLHCPFMHMSLIEGQPLDGVLWDHLHGLYDAEENDECRRRALKSVAETIDQLRQFSYSMAGALEFNVETNEVAKIGPMLMLDKHADNKRYPTRRYDKEEINLYNVNFNASII